MNSKCPIFQLGQPFVARLKTRKLAGCMFRTAFTALASLTSYGQTAPLICGSGPVQAITFGVGNDTEAAWSPDGQQIAFQTDRSGDLDIAIVDLSTGGVKLVVMGEGNACYPAWMPDGALVYSFCSYTGTAVRAEQGQALFGYGLRLWRSGEAMVLTEGRWRDYTPCAPPRGDVIYYSSTEGENSDDRVSLWQLTLRPKLFKERIYSPKNSRCGAVQPSLSPDGSTLLWAQQEDFRYNNWRLCIASVTNVSNYTYLTGNMMAAYAPRWSPDGHYIVFTGFQQGDPAWSIYLMSMRTKEMSRLDVGSGNSRSPAWSPDGKELVFENDRSGFYKLYRTKLLFPGQSEGVR